LAARYVLLESVAIVFAAVKRPMGHIEGAYVGAF